MYTIIGLYHLINSVATIDGVLGQALYTILTKENILTKILQIFLMTNKTDNTGIIVMKKVDSKNAPEIAMPIGGIGAGCISINSWGGLQDWEIYNSPGKGNSNPFSFFTLYAKTKNRTPVTKVLQGPVAREYGRGAHGFDATTGAGLPHFREAVFSASYPFANIEFKDKKMPLRAELTAWNPFIPHNGKDSSIPCAIFQWTITNPTKKRVDATIFMNMTNIVGSNQQNCAIEKNKINKFKDTKTARGILFTQKNDEKKNNVTGSIVVATPHKKITKLAHWYGGGWFDSITDFWTQAQTGELNALPKKDYLTDDRGTIGAQFSLKPGEKKTIPFVVSWLTSQGKAPFTLMPFGKESAEVPYKTFAEAQWKDAWDVAEYVIKNLNRLEKETKLYDETIRETTLPEYVIDSVTMTSSILKSPTCLRFENGDFWAWEGCHNDKGCCHGTCTHVWNYQQMIPFLFPALERNIRESEYKYGVDKNGAMDFRLDLPLGDKLGKETFACADGQFGCVLKAYRDWKILGDDEWLKSLWPKIKKTVDYSFQKWDFDKDGVMEGIQHNTYDINFWGPNTMCGSFYLGALRAAEEMSSHLGDKESADFYHELFVKGSKWSDENLFNGEYYIQKVNLDAATGKGLPKNLANDDWWRGPTVNGYPKYQYGNGCLSDQLLGQLFAEITGLGDLYKSKNINKTVDSIFKYNFKTDFFDHANVQRVYALDDEAGTVLCSWPKGEKERFPFPYSEEVWTGIEYAVAALLAYRGKAEKALKVVEAVRERYNGVKWNPFDEVECGHHYARAMASYALLLAFSGFLADMPNRKLTFSPKINEENFKTFFSVDSGWGLYSQKIDKKSTEVEIDVRYGKIKLKKIQIDIPFSEKISVKLGKKKVDCKIEKTGRGVEIIFSREITLNKQNKMLLSVK